MEKGLIKEMCLITAIISDIFTNKVYNAKNGSYFDTLDIIVDVAGKTYNTFKETIENQDIPDIWLSVYDEYNVDCYDDLVIKVAGRILWQDYELNISVE